MVDLELQTGNWFSESLRRVSSWLAMTKKALNFNVNCKALWILIFSQFCVWSEHMLNVHPLIKFSVGHFGNSMWTHIFTRLIQISRSVSVWPQKRKKTEHSAANSCVFLTNHIKCDFQLAASIFLALHSCSCLYLLPLQGIFEPHSHTQPRSHRSFVDWNVVLCRLARP